MTPEEYMHSVKNAMIDEMKKATDEIFTGLVLNRKNNQLPERIFRDYFLPCFIGYIKDNPNWVNEWVTIAGTPTSEVDIFDEMTKEVIYTVPSLFNTSNTFNLDKPISLKTAFERSEMHNNNLPGSGRAIAMNALSEQYTEYTNAIDFTRVNKMWTDILNRYNLLKKPLDEPASNISPDDYFE